MASPTEQDIEKFIKEEEEREFQVRLSDYCVEDYVVLLLFWVLAGVVFAQFFTRYVLGDPIVWTEEVARYLLILVTFLGSVMAVRKNTHIFVEFFYRLLPPKLGRSIYTLTDLIRIAFFATGAWLSWNILPIVGRQTLVTIGLSLSIIYGTVLVSFVLMTLRSVLLAWSHWKDGYTPLTNDEPDAARIQDT
jgi:TRAP-type C4-dicarboxylate transport system permease small subunit